MSKLMMVLGDGETFSDLMNCQVIEVPDDWDEDYVPDEGVSVVRAVFTHAAMIIRRADVTITEDPVSQKKRIGIRGAHG